MSHDNEKLGVASEEIPKKADLGVFDNGSSSSDYLGILKKEFHRPFLSLLVSYLTILNNKNRKIQTCVADFKDSNKKIFFFVLALDMIALSLFLFIVLIVMLRGLGILGLFKECLA